MRDDRMTPRLLHPVCGSYAFSLLPALCFLSSKCLPIGTAQSPLSAHSPNAALPRPQLCHVATMTSIVPSSSLWLLSLEATVNVVFAVYIKDMMCLYTSARGSSAGSCYLRGSATFQAKSFPLVPAIVLP